MHKEKRLVHLFIEEHKVQPTQAKLFIKKLNLIYRSHYKSPNSTSLGKKRNEESKHTNEAKAGFKMEAREQGESIFHHKIAIEHKKRKNCSMRNARPIIKEKEVKLDDISTPKEIPSQKAVKVKFPKPNVSPKKQNMINIDTRNINIFDDNHPRKCRARNNRSLRLRLGKKVIRKVKPVKLKDPVQACASSILDAVIRALCHEVIDDLPKDIVISKEKVHASGAATQKSGVTSRGYRGISADRNFSIRRKRCKRRNFSRHVNYSYVRNGRDKTLPTIDQRPMKFSPPNELFSDPRILDKESFDKLILRNKHKKTLRMKHNLRKTGGFSMNSPNRSPRVKFNRQQLINYLFNQKTTKKDQDLIFIYTQKLQFI
ncbi:unnamed protein product [Moneuplotes crassus]|uniref:Uncharacterized protein n=1 Tax=Euplotes crassus TaxID=5936 RepID=A0AAD2DBA7_EUPCR|nr:unnamed protein product [Moneuplotes crassus]